MKKILILANNSGGLYRFRKELIEKMIEEGHQVYASTPFDDNIDDLKEIGVSLIETPINRRGMNPVKDFGLLVTYFKMIKKIKPDLIITYTIKPNLYGGTIARILNKQYAINITGLGTAFQKEGFLKKMVVTWYKFVCKKVKVVFFENVGNKEVFTSNKILKEDKCVCLNGAGVNLEDFPFKPYPENEDILHFLFIGRIMKEKGIEELFYAINRLKEEGYPVVLDILGGYEDNYKEKTDEYVNKGIVNYYGYQSDVRPFIEKDHCFVLPSYHEGMANTLLENASMGRPLITSNIHGCLEVIHDNGYLCKVKDQEDLYKKMKEFLELNHDERVQMGFNSRKHVEEVFDKRKVVEKDNERSWVMRVLHVLNTNSYSGAENVAITIINHMPDVDSTYLSLKGPISEILKKSNIKY